MGNRINNNLANTLENFMNSMNEKFQSSIESQNAINEKFQSSIESQNAINEKFQNSIESQNAVNKKILEVLNKLSAKLDEQNK